MSLLSKLIYATTYGPYQAFVRDCQNPQHAQERVWRETVAEISKSPFWADRFKQTTRLEDFSVTDYDSYRHSLDESYKSKMSLLSGKPIFFWAESSGTSGNPKLFPITKLYQEQFQRTVKPLVHSYLRRFPQFLEKPVLYFAATNSKRVSPAGVESGYISNFNYRNISSVLRGSYAFPYEIFADAQTFDQWSQIYALATDLSAMISVTPSQVELFAKNILSRREENWAYLTGAKSMPGHLPKVKVSLQRLKCLEKAFSDRFMFENFWPSLRFICSWQSSACGLQAKNLQSFIGTHHVRQIDATYSASEGWVNVPIENTTGGPIHPGAHVFEFSKPGDTEHLLKMWELQPGEVYEIYFTTAMGFIRYRLHDLVKCTGYFHKSPIIEFYQKSGNDVSLGLVQVAEAQLLESAAAIGLPVTGEWIFTPNATGDGLLLFYTKLVDTQVILARLNDVLANVNPYYAEYLKKGLIRPLEGRCVASLDSVGRERHAQTKPKILHSQYPVHLENKFSV